MDLFRRMRQQREVNQRLEEIRPRLYRVAYSWCHDPHLADDLVQQTLVKALQNSGQLRDAKVMDAWMFRILTNCWNDHFRRQRDTVDIDDVPQWHERTPEIEHGRDQIVARVRQAIAALPDHHRYVITLVDLGGLSYNEVAEVLDIPLGTLMSRVSRARRSLKESLLDLQPETTRQTAQIRRIK